MCSGSTAAGRATVAILAKVFAVWIAERWGKSAFMSGFAASSDEYEKEADL